MIDYYCPTTKIYVSRFKCESYKMHKSHCTPFPVICLWPRASLASKSTREYLLNNLLTTIVPDAIKSIASRNALGYGNKKPSLRITTALNLVTVGRLHQLRRYSDFYMNFQLFQIINCNNTQTVCKTYVNVRFVSIIENGW